jgi:hypothetical protein
VVVVMVVVPIFTIPSQWPWSIWWWLGSSWPVWHLCFERDDSVHHKVMFDASP